MKRFLLALALLLLPSVAWAQCNGVFSPNQVCGSIAGGPPGPVTISTFAGGLVVGTSPISGGLPGQFLFINSGVLGAAALAYSNLPQIATSTVLGNFSGGNATPSQQAVPSCANDGVHILTNNAGAGFNCTALAGAVSEVKIAAGTGISLSGNCDITSTNAGSPCTPAINPSAPVVCDIISTAAATCNNGGSAANNGTYTTPAGAKWLTVKLVGGGGGGGGSGTAASGMTAGGTGGTTTFGTSLLTGNGGAGGVLSGTANLSAGGTATGGDTNVTGGTGTGSGALGGNPICTGATSPFGGAGGEAGSLAGTAAAANSGSGGGGGGPVNGTVNNGGCGAAGGYLEKLLTSPNATYSYAIGAGGTGGAAGTSGFIGGLGGAGHIIVTAYFQ